jgi:hypothetical protein
MRLYGKFGKGPPMALLLPFALTGIRHLPLAALKQDTSKQQEKRCDISDKQMYATKGARMTCCSRAADK